MFNVCQTVTIRLQVGFPHGKLGIGNTEQLLCNVFAQHEHPEQQQPDSAWTRLQKFIQPASPLGTRLIVTSFTRSAKACGAAVHRGPQLDV
jgi:hypothetical protein